MLQPSDDGVQRRAHLMAERGQKHVFSPVGRLGFPPRCLFLRHQRLAVALDLFYITANGVGERLVNGLVEPSQVIYVAQVWGPVRYRATVGARLREEPDIQRPLPTTRNPTPLGPLPWDAKPTLSPRSRPIGDLHLSIFGLLRAVWSDRMSDRRRAEISSASSRIRPGRPTHHGPDLARKRFPLRKNGFDIREDEIRQPHRLHYNGSEKPFAPGVGAEHLRDRAGASFAKSLRAPKLLDFGSIDVAAIDRLCSSTARSATAARVRTMVTERGRRSVSAASSDTGPIVGPRTML